MTKRIFAFVLALVLVVSLMPQVTVGVTAEGAKAPGASEWCDHTSHDGWTEVTKATGLPKTTGKYYLSEDIDLTAVWEPSSGAEIHLCLNGHDITQKTANTRILNVSAGRNISIYDCAKAYEGETYVGGVISGGNRENGSAVWISRGGTAGNNPGVFNLYGGRIYGNTKSDVAAGGAFYLQSGQTESGTKKAGGVFNMYGGEIVGNGTKSKSVGGAVYLHGVAAASRSGIPATFNMYGGLISENKAKQGGAVSGVEDAVINIQGGKLTNNEVSGSGGAIYTEDDMVLTVANAQISGNKSVNASAIYAQNRAQITLKDATVTGNEASSTSAEGYGAAIYMCGDTSKLTIGGTTTVSGNTIPNAAIADIFLNSSSDNGSMETLYVNEMTGGDVRIGVKDKAVTKASDVIALNGTQTAQFPVGALVYFNGTQDKYVGYEEGAFKFVEGHIHDGHLYAAWDGSTVTSGYYYLTGDVESSAALSISGDVHICFNGHNVIAQKADQRVFNIAKGGKLTLEDCTATTDAQDNYISGGLTAKKDLVMTKTYGSLINVNAGGTLNMTGGKIYGVNDTAEGASPIYMQCATTTNGKAVFNMTGGEISGNTAKRGGAIHMAAPASNATNTDTVNLSELNIDGGRILNNTAVDQSGAIHVGLDKVTIKNAKINGNMAKSAAATKADKNYGAIYVTGAQSDVHIENTEIKNNTAKTVSAVNLASSAKLTLKNVTISGNISTGTSYGAVNIANGAATLKLEGTTVIYDNLNASNAQQNLHLQKDNTTAVVDADVSGLTTGAKVGISLLKARMDAGQMYFSTTGMTGNPGLCVSDDDAYAVSLNATSGRLELAEKGSVTPPTPPTPPATHTHKLCNDASCTDHGADVTFEPWGDDEEEKGKLPTSGNWYLVADIDVSAATGITSEVNLCLNGKTVTQTATARIYTVNAGGKLSITDCATAYNGDTYVGGKLTGGKNNFGSAVYVLNGNTFNLYGGRITNCHPQDMTTAQTGAAVFLHNANTAGATFNMYGGEITGNGGDNCWGGAVSNGGGNKGKTVYVNIYGGKIFGNTAGNGGAFRMRTDAVVNVYGGEIYGNHATATGGAIYMELNKGDVKLNLQGGKIYDNTAATNGGAIYIGTGVLDVTVSGTAFVQNNKVGTAENNLYLAGNTKITVGQLATGAKIGLSRELNRTSDVVSTNTVTAADLEFFTSDNAEDYNIKQDKAGYLLLAAKPITTEHMHNACNDAACTDHEVIPFVKWDKTDSLPTSGNYYLANDVTVSAATTVSGNLNLCLNGHTITMTTQNRVFTMNTNVSMSIIDCGTTGTITGGRNDFGSVAFVGEGSIFNLFGGKLTGNGPKTTDAAATGCAVFLRSSNGAGATFNMYGGEITGNGGEKSWGGAVSNASGNANNAVYVNMYGGKIYGNTALNGGAFRMENKSVTTIYGGEIYDNTASASGGAIFLTKGAELVLAGGKITGNTAPMGAGVYVNENCKVTVSGSPVLTENKSGKLQNNLYLAGETIITLGDVKEDAKVSVTAAQLNRAISSESDVDYTKNIVSDSAYKLITYKDKVLYIAGATDHNHCICTDKSSGCDHTELVWNAWESDSTLPTSGTYYLTCDVQLVEGHYSNYTVKGTLNLCLNGFTVTAAEGRRVMMSGKGGTINLTDCNEKPGMLTGGTQTWGAAVNINAGSTFNMFGGKISGNKNLATSGGIGAIYVQGDGAVFNMYGGEISNNEGVNGTIFSPKLTEMEKGMQINLYGGTICNNKATTVLNSKNEKTGGNGGAIYANVGTTILVDGVVIKNNTADVNGGGIFATGNGTVITMKSGEISGNKAQNGGGIITQTRSKLIMNGGTIKGNTTKSNGGGVYISTKTSIEMNGGSISGNTAKSGGGAYFYRSTAVLNGGTIGYNYAKREVKVTNGKETKSGGTAGGFYGSGAKVTMSGTSVIGNKADSNGGGIVLGRVSYKENGVTKYDLVRLDMYGGSVSDNVSGENAGGMLIQSKETVVNMYGGRFTGNKATSNAGAIYVSTDTTFNMTGGTITGNHTEKSGGAFYCYKSTANITGGDIHHNTATTSAGMLNAATQPCVVTIKNIKIYGNEAKSGGALVSQSKAIMYVEDCEIYDNKSLTGHGGAVFVSNKYSKGYFTNCKFYNNDSAGMGGAVYASDFSDSSYTNCEFYDNHSAKQGGALMLYIASTSVLENTTFRTNLADDYGGGVAVRGNSVMTNCLVENNTSKTNGGGIATDVNSTTGSGIMSGLEMHNTQVKNNTAGGQGGGFYIYKGCRVELYDTEITGNKATTEGGGIWAYEDLELHNTSITGNTSGAGYAVYMADSQYDGHSYFTSRNKMSGNVIIKDNEGGNLYMGKDVVIVITADGLGQDTYIDLLLHSGTVTNRIFGAYNYEGGNLQYVVTAGDRSITDPEAYVVETEPVPEDSQATEGNQTTEPADQGEDNTMLYVGIGGIAAVILLAAVAVVIGKKKKANKAESK